MADKFAPEISEITETFKEKSSIPTSLTPEQKKVLILKAPLKCSNK